METLGYSKEILSVSASVKLAMIDMGNQQIVCPLDSEDGINVVLNHLIPSCHVLGILVRAHIPLHLLIHSGPLLPQRSFSSLLSGNVHVLMRITLQASREGISYVGPETCAIVPSLDDSMQARWMVKRIGFVLPDC